MNNDFLEKLENSINKLKEKKCKLHFFVQDTKGNAKASIRYIYQLAYTLHVRDYNVTIIHEQKDYQGIGSWLDEKYMQIPHQPIEGQNLEIAPEDFIIVPELYGHVMEQTSKLPCGKIVLCQSYDYMFETLPPGASWSQYGFLKCITTSEEVKEYVSTIMRGVSYDIITPTISNCFTKQLLPPKPFVAVHSRDQRDSVNIIKNFYLKYPQYRWITFRDMRGLSEIEFAETLKDCFLSVWIDDASGFGTFPLESMACGVPVLGKMPDLQPEWVTEDNGIWITEKTVRSDWVADVVQKG